MKKILTNVGFLFIIVLGLFVIGTNPVYASEKVEEIAVEDYSSYTEKNQFVYGTDELKNGAYIDVKNVSEDMNIDNTIAFLSNNSDIYVASKADSSLFISKDDQNTTTIFINRDVTAGDYQAYILTGEAYNNFNEEWNNEKRPLDNLDKFQNNDGCFVVDYTK